MIQVGTPVGNLTRTSSILVRTARSVNLKVHVRMYTIEVLREAGFVFAYPFATAYWTRIVGVRHHGDSEQEQRTRCPSNFSNPLRTRRVAKAKNANANANLAAEMYDPDRVTVMKLWLCVNIKRRLKRRFLHFPTRFLKFNFELHLIFTAICRASRDCCQFLHPLCQRSTMQKILAA